MTTISGQKPLNPNLWGEYLPVIADIPLEPFSETEARQFLASKRITDEEVLKVILTFRGRLPLWLATLADARQQGTADIGDPTGDAVERFLKWETDPVRREVAVAAALPRALNQDVLTVITPAEETVGCSAGCGRCLLYRSGEHRGCTTMSCEPPCCGYGAPKRPWSGVRNTTCWPPRMLAGPARLRGSGRHLGQPELGRLHARTDLSPALRGPARKPARGPRLSRSGSRAQRGPRPAVGQAHRRRGPRHQ